MSKKITVPKGMYNAASLSTVKNNDGGYESMNQIIKKVEQTSCQWPGLESILESALRWLSENPIVPSDEQLEAMIQQARKIGDPYLGLWREVVVEWQRRMFLAPEPEYIGEEEIGQFCGRYQRIDEAVREAYRRGKESSKR